MSMAWGARLLTQDATLTPANDDGLTCGSVFGSLRDKPSYGGEQPYPAGWTDQCEAAAQDQAVWLVVPALAGSAAAIFLIGTCAGIVRRARSEGRSTGALSA